ncbi:MAG: carbohydrate kinase [Verrucomicrobia bacterium]|nr:carbohydrate kinase [Verrucomicrobiota bacterium]MBU1735391.1 carbohydrate kinase [Verrucomicrobiota bacterium]MBU1857454.1 carbohydrate kinase [Verrucomicrobiota bacterium]
MKSKQIKLLSFGEVLWDIIDDQAYIGGAPFNLAAHASQCGLDAYLLTCVGADDLGRRALAEIDRMNVHRQYVQTDRQHPTSTVTVRLSAKGQPAYVIHKNAAWDFVDVRKDMMAGLVAENFNVVCFGSLAQREALSRASLMSVLEALKGVPTFFDVNLRQNYYSRELLTASLQRATVLKLNDSEVKIIADLLFGRNMTATEFARAIQGKFPVRVILITMGAKGCALTEGGSVEICPVRQVAVVDTVGAGDAFSAAFLAGWLRGKTAIEAATMGNLLGAFVASRRGAIPDYDNEIRRWLGL